ncbi:MAG: hypothetical protein DRJ38_09185 [Thermoprotei archaeon]|nr:MAG: hypothetical protein DRJ38_09185 [Thermoprotei archaeon]
MVSKLNEIDEEIEKTTDKLKNLYLLRLKLLARKLKRKVRNLTEIIYYAHYEIDDYEPILIMNPVFRVGDELMDDFTFFKVYGKYDVRKPIYAQKCELMDIEGEIRETIEMMIQFFDVDGELIKDPIRIALNEELYDDP